MSNQVDEALEELNKAIEELEKGKQASKDYVEHVWGFGSGAYNKAARRHIRLALEHLKYV